MNKGFKIRKNNTVSDLITRYSQDIQDELDKFPSVITVPVQWGQQDSNNHLNNVNWLRFVESGRADYTMMLSLFMTPKKYLELISFKANGLIIKRATIDYMGQVIYPDSLTIATRVIDLESDKFKFLTKLYSLANNKLVGKCETIVVGFNFKTGSTSNFDQTLVDTLTKMENDAKQAQKLALKLPTRINSNI